LRFWPDENLIILCDQIHRIIIVPQYV